MGVPVRARERKVCVHGGPAVGAPSAPAAPSLVLKLRPSPPTPTPGPRGCDEPLRAGPATHIQRGHGRPGVEVPADPAACGSQCPLHCGPLLAVRLPCLSAAGREGDRAGSPATRHCVEEEPDGGRNLQVLLPSRLHPTRVLSSPGAPKTGSPARTASQRPFHPDLLILLPFFVVPQRGDGSQGALPQPLTPRDVRTPALAMESLFAFLPKPEW